MEDNENILFKKPLTVEEQTKYLAENKRVVYNMISTDQATSDLYKFNYINVITPFKHLFAKTDEAGVPVKVDGKHVYERNVDFGEYFKCYQHERNAYPVIYKSLLQFEESFNAILSYEVIHFYNITDLNQFKLFTKALLHNIDSLPYRDSAKNHMKKTVNGFENELLKYNSPYIFFDRLTLSELITVFRSVDAELRDKIFESIVSNKCSLGYYDFETFDSVLPIIIQVRNYVCHGNSLEVLCMYYRIKDKKFRTRSDRRRYRNVIKRIIDNE